MLRTTALLASLAAVVSAQSVLNTPADIYSCVTAAFPYTCQDPSGCSVIFRDFTTSIQLASITSIPSGSGVVSWVPNVAVGTTIMGTLTASSTGATFPTAQLQVEEQLGATACTLSAAVISTYGGAATTAGGEPAATTGAGATSAASSAASAASSSVASASASAASSIASSSAALSSRASSAASAASSVIAGASSSASSAASAASSAASAAAPAPTPTGAASPLVQGSFLAAALGAGVALFA